MDTYPLTIVGASRPYPGENVNGDNWVAHWHGDVCRLTVIDGLGHGPAAAAASQAALRRLEEVATVEPDETLHACHEALIGSRGAVMLVVSIDWRSMRLRVAGVGNVEARLRLERTERRVTSDRGIVGAMLPRIQTIEYPLTPNWLLLVHTDGVRARFDLTAETVGTTVSIDWAQRFLDRWARPTDDATVVVAAPRLV